MATNKELEVVIIGGGLAGMATAIATALAGFRVTVLEQASELREIGAGIEVPPNASRILDAWGLLQSIDRDATHASNIVIRSYRDGAILSKANLVPACRDRYGHPHLSVHRADLHDSLIRESKRLGVRVKLGADIIKLDLSVSCIHLRSGEIYRPSLVVGSDGGASFSRQILLETLDPPVSSGDIVYRVVLPIEDMVESGNEGLLELLEPPELNAWFGPYGHAVGYVLNRQRLYNVVLTQPDPDPQHLELKSREADLGKLRHLFKDWNPAIKSLLDTAKEAKEWTLPRFSDALTWRHDSGKFTLLGDAAHGMTPYLGQGAAQGLEDAAVLGTILSRIRSADQIHDALKIYEDIRKPRALSIKRRSWEMKYVHGYPDGPLQRERDRQMLRHAPFEGYPNVWADPVYQRYLWGYNAFEEADRAWKAYERGEWPGTFGKSLTAAKL